MIFFSNLDEIIFSLITPQDDLIRHSTNWHKEGGSSIRPEDVVVSAFVQLRRIAVRI